MQKSSLCFSSTTSQLSLRPVQQRLFSGRLFPADINNNLHRFAQRHNLKSNVWVPLKAFDTVLKPLSVFVLPSAALCDISVSPDGPTVGQDLGRSTANRVLVNAEHTSCPPLFEGFLELLVRSPDTAGGEDRRGGATATAAELCWATPRNRVATATPRPPDALRNVRLVDCPVNYFGDPITEPEQLREMARLKKEKHYVSNYWDSAPGTKPRTSSSARINVEEMEWPGRYNPTYANGYIPVTLSGASLRADLTQVMQVRVAKYGYVSRVWVTLSEAEAMYGTRLRPECADDAPAVVYGGDSVEPVVLYCADQFVDSERLFPNPREIELAGKGVWLSQERMRGFPLLYKLHKESMEATRREEENREAVAKRTVPAGSTVLSDARVGADTTMRDAKRHLRFIEEKGKFANLRLFGFRTRDDERYHLRENDLESRLREWAILWGFPTPHFVSHRHLSTYGMRPREGEIGLNPFPAPTRLWHEVWADGETWYNIAQLTEPWTALSLFYHHPVHFLTRRRLPRALATQCCELQLRMRYASDEWVPRYVARDAGWRVREGALGVPFGRSDLDWDYSKRPREPGEIAPAMANTLINLDEVMLPTDAKCFLRSYRPVDDRGRPYLRTMRMLTALRALEQGYTSPVWVPLYPDSSYVCKLGSGESALSGTATPVGPALREEEARLLSGNAFATPPLVRFRGTLFANAAEVENLDSAAIETSIPLSEVNLSARAREERGEGASAEKYCVPESRQQRVGAEKAILDVAETFTRSDNPFDASYDVPIDDF